MHSSDSCSDGWILEIPKRNLPKSALDPDTTKVRENFPEKLVMKLGQRIRGAHLLKRKEKREPQQSEQRVQRSRGWEEVW